MRLQAVVVERLVPKKPKKVRSSTIPKSRKGKGDKRQRKASLTTRQPRSEVSNRTSTSPVGQEGRPPCFSDTKGRTRIATTGILRSAFFLETEQCRSGTDCPFGHLSKDYQPSSPTRQSKSDDIKDYVIAKKKSRKHREHFHAKGHFSRHKTTEPSAHDTKVAHFQGASPS